MQSLIMHIGGLINDPRDGMGFEKGPSQQLSPPCWFQTGSRHPVLCNPHRGSYAILGSIPSRDQVWKRKEWNTATLQSQQIEKLYAPHQAFLETARHFCKAPKADGSVGWRLTERATRQAFSIKPSASLGKSWVSLDMRLTKQCVVASYRLGTPFQLVLARVHASHEPHGFCVCSLRSVR